MTVDVKGNSPLWLKVKDLAEGMTYRFRIKAKTFTYGPEIEANITTGPGEGRQARRHTAPCTSSGLQVGGSPWGPELDLKTLGHTELYSSISCPKAPPSLLPPHCPSSSLLFCPIPGLVIGI